MPTPFVELFSESSPDALEAELYETLEAKFEDWDPAAGGLDVWLSKAFIRIASSVFNLASIVSREAFKTFGETIVKVPPILAAPATVSSTWKAIDEAGYTIPDGTLVTIAAAGDEAVAFRAVGAVVIAPEGDETGTGEVLLEAVEPGETANGLTATPDLLSSLSFIDSIALTGATANGVDAEDEDTYLNRLTEELQTLTLSAVIPRDYEILARRIAGVARATALDNYDAEAEEEDVPLVISVAVADADGAKLSAGVKEDVKELLEERSLSNVETYVIDPTYTKVGAKVEIVVSSGFDKPTVTAAVQERLESYISPANHGVPAVGDASTSTSWENVLFVYLNEVLAEADRVQGCSRVVSVKLKKGAGSLEAKDVELGGPAALPEVGTIEVVAV